MTKLDIQIRRLIGVPRILIVSQRSDYRFTLVTVNGKIPLGVSPSRLWHTSRACLFRNPHSAFIAIDTLYLESNLYI
jgi:hypothetical protein